MFHAFRGKRVLVTGHTGFKGSWLCEWLLSLGAKLTGFSLPDLAEEEPKLFSILHLKNRMDDRRGDIRNLDSLLAVFEDAQPEIVFHLAAQAIVQSAYDKPKANFDTNIGGTVNLLEALRQTSSTKAAVFVASDKVYQNKERGQPFQEHDALGGADPYSASKACAELVLQSYLQSFFQNSNLQCASVRSGNVIGGGDWGAHRLLPDCVRAWSKGDPVTLRQPEAIRPWLHVLEPLSAYLCLGASLLAKKPQRHGQAFNIAPELGHQQSVGGLLTTLQESWPGAQVELSPNTPKMREAKVLKLSNEKARTQLNWRPSLSIEETLELTSVWYQAYYSEEETDLIALTQRQILRYVEVARQQGQPWAQ
ncbi:MAG: CDP-glucose 4,6-dehydratase [Planctomycetota bacterium]|nr:CDP-glucose 4,6-dehydratase [Planctomycetota bacterium]